MRSERPLVANEMQKNEREASDRSYEMLRQFIKADCRFKER